MDDIDLSSIMVGNDEPTTVTPQSTVAPKSIVTPEATAVIDSTAMESTAPLEKQARVTKIRLYFDTFPTKLAGIKPKKPLDKLSDDQLQELEKNINYTLGAKTNVDAMAKSFPLLLKAAEELIAQFTPLRIQGTHAVCFEPDVQDMIKYTIIDSGLAGINSTPQQRLAFTLISTAMRQHAVNSAIESMTAEQKQAYAKAMAPKQEAAVDSKYADL